MFVIFPNTQAIADYLAKYITQKIIANPATSLGLATGSTMEPIYARLLQKVHTDQLDLSQLTTFNLDEYIGLGPGHPQSYYYFMQQHLFAAAGLTPAQVNLPCGVCADLEQECQDYAAKLKALGGVDTQLLGIGSNGHIGFNEPGTPFDSVTHVVELAPKTRRDNARFFDHVDDVPTHAITMGIAEILAAKEIFIVATGRHKAEIMARLYSSAIDEQLPASALKQHAHLRILVDAEAAELLPTHIKQVV